MLANISIKLQLRAAVVFPLLALILCSMFSLLNEKKVMIEDRKMKTEHLVQSAHSLLEFYHKKELSGELTQEVAQAEAFKAIESLRYNKKEYFWINDESPKMIMHPIKKELNGKDLGEFKDPNGA